MIEVGINIVPEDKCVGIMLNGFGFNIKGLDNYSLLVEIIRNKIKNLIDL